MREHMPRMDEIKPRCPTCGEQGFEAIANGSVKRADFAIVMIVCQNESCRSAIGVIPSKEVFDE